jgi:lysophospholipase L1-like esterase
MRGFFQHRRHRLIFIPVAIILGILLLVGAVEVVLRLLGWWSLRAGNPGYETLANADVIVVCAGDSHTEGVGAPAGYDYPRQLAARLRESRHRTRIAVVNVGRSGFNSSQAADRAADFMAHMPRRPTLIIFNAGKNNDHNFTDARILPDEARKMSRLDQFKYLLAHSRAFRLGQITVSRLQDQISVGAPDYETGWDKVLNVRGAEEQALLRNWIIRDVEFLRERTADRNVPIVLLNYWLKVREVDEAFAELARRPRIFFVNVIDFGSPIFHVRLPRTMLSPDQHPNQYGYAIIARLVERTLEKNRLIPPPD